MAEYILNGSTLTISAYRKGISVDVPRILASNTDAMIDTLAFEEGTETIWTVCNTLGEGPKGIKTVVFPKSLVSIEANAFEGCSALEKLELPENLNTIGRNAFKGCSSLSSIVFPNSLVAIGDQAFSECTSLKKADLPENLSALGKYAFNRCSSLRSVQLPQSLTVIEDGVFNECRSLSQVDIPEGVVSIRDFAFSSTGIHTLVLPSSLQTVGDCAFGIVPELQVRIPCTAPVYTSNAFFEMDDLPPYRVFDPNQVSTVGNQRSSDKVDATGSIQCPRCHSNNISQRIVHKLFSFFKAMFLLLFPPFLLLGFIGKNRIECFCHACGQKWEKKPPKFSMESLGEWFMYI